MSSKPYFSIVVPAYNNTRLLASCLSSVLKQRFKDYEIIVSDDSTNNEVENIVASFAAPEISYVRHDRRVPSNNWEDALSLANGKIICLLHHDEAFLYSNHLDEIKAVFDEGTGVSVVISDLVVDVGPRQLVKSRNLFFRFLLFFFPKYIVYHNFIGPSGCLFFRKNMMHCFDHSYRYLVDCIWYDRLLLRGGYKFSKSSIVLSHSHHSGQITSTLDIDTDYELELFRYFSKCSVWSSNVFLLSCFVKKRIKLITKKIHSLVKDK